MKTKEELETLKKEIADLCKKIDELTEEERKEIGIYSRDPNELTEEELAQVSGGGLCPRSESVANPFALLGNVDTLNRPPTPPSPVAESVKTAVDAALQNW